jgi:hypothetical protein
MSITRRLKWTAYQSAATAFRVFPSEDNADQCRRTYRAFCEAMMCSADETERLMSTLDAHLANAVATHAATIATKGHTPCAAAE